MSFVTAHKRLLIGAFLVLVLSALIWFVGPLLGSDDERPLGPWSVRLLCVLLVLAIWLGGEALLRWSVKRRNEKLMTALATDTEDAKLAREEGARLQGLFADAMRTLKSTKLGGQSDTKLLYQLPWYMFIGAPGSGKTTALINSGLSFPLAEPGKAATALNGIGGTRNCDWWFTERAVLIDTAGRYMTQDSNAQVDQAAWRTFLGLLKKFRPRQPINGAIVTLSIRDLLGDDVAARQKYAQQVRIRVEELQQELGVQFPVYLMVTMTDLVSGFSEFFASMDPEQRAQVWGASFDFDLKTRIGKPARASFDEAFPPLVEKVNQLLLQRLQEERDIDRRNAMYAFPQQFAAVGPLISSFLEEAFNETRYASPALLRGVYFTSGTRFGAPIDRLILGLSASLDLRGGTARSASSATAAKSFFIQRLMTDVVFAEAGLAGHSEKRETQLRRLNWGVITLAALTGVGLVSSWTVSYFNNRAGLEAAASASTEASRLLATVGAPAIDDLPILVEALAAMVKIPPAVHDPVADPTVGMRFGLYQGKPVSDQVDERYRNALQQGLMPRVALQLEAVMAAPQVAPEAQYAALKTYLMMYDAKRMNREWFVGAVDSMWRALRYDPTLVVQARGHLQALTDAGDLQVERFHARNDALIADTRERVARSSTLVDRATATLRLSGGAEGIRLSEALGPGGVAVLERSSESPLTEMIPGVFTAEGYRNVVKPRLREVTRMMSEEEVWVLGSKASGVGVSDPAQTAAEVQRRYFSEYESTWRGVLNDVRLRKLDGLRAAQSAAQTLSSSDSPLRRLVITVADQTRLAAVGGGAVAGAAKKAAEENAQRTLTDKVGSMTSGIFGSSAGQVVGQAINSVKPGAADSSRQAEQRLEESFADVRRLAGDGKAGEIDAALAIITEVASELLAVQQKLSSGQSIKEMPARLINAKSQADRFAMPVSGVIKGLVEIGEVQASGGIRQEIKAGVGGAAAMCKRAIPGKYPFNRNNPVDVGVQDFVGVFKAGGELDQYFNSNLAQFVDKSGSVWRLKSTGEGSPPVSQATLRQFQNADAIRTAFMGGGTAQVVVDLTLISGDAEVKLDYDGAQQALKVGAPVRLSWPARPGAKLSIGGVNVVSADGAWALFRLVDKGQVDPASAGAKLRLAYTSPVGTRVLVELQAGSGAFNPFRLRELDSFACPQE